MPHPIFTLGPTNEVAAVPKQHSNMNGCGSVAGLRSSGPAHAPKDKVSQQVLGAALELVWTSSAKFESKALFDLLAVPGKEAGEYEFCGGSMER
eukprot:6462481-Amphidinium_carterae.2